MGVIGNLKNMAGKTTQSSRYNTKDVQKLLNGYGYGLEEDGVQGPLTTDAIKKFQAENNLTVDGIVGEQTWNALNSGNSKNQQTNQAQQNQGQQADALPDYSKYQYDDSTNEGYNYADAMLKEAQNKLNTPSYNMGALEDAYSAIVGRDKFSYDVNSDATYQQYRDLYTAQGKLAQLDAQGQAAALTGGYGNSYAQTAGQQAYQGYLQKLNEVVPELYGMAYDQYQQEGQDLLNRYAMVKEMEDTRYGLAQDEQNAAWQAMNYWQGVKDSEYNKGADNYYNSIQLGTNAEQTEYNRKQNEYENLVNKMASTGYVPTKEEREAAGMTEGEANAWANAYKQQMAASAASGTGKKYATPDEKSDEYYGNLLVNAATDYDAELIWGILADSYGENYADLMYNLYYEQRMADNEN